MTEPYVHILPLERSTTFYTSRGARDAAYDALLSEFGDWLVEFAPSASMQVVGVQYRLEVEVTIPDPDEAVAYRLRWT